MISKYTVFYFIVLAPSHFINIYPVLASESVYLYLSVMVFIFIDNSYLLV